jgi:hypothetical protein
VCFMLLYCLILHSLLVTPRLRFTPWTVTQPLVADTIGRHLRWAVHLLFRTLTGCRTPWALPHLLHPRLQPLQDFAQLTLTAR